MRFTFLFRIFGLIIGSLVCVGGVYAQLPGSDGTGATLPSMAPVLSRALPAVVNIAVTQTNTRAAPPLSRWGYAPYYRRAPRPTPRTNNLGSGVIIDAKKGHILTCYHVVKQADTIAVTLHDGRKLNASIIGTDTDSDIAVLKIDADNLESLPIANSDAVRVGDFVLAIGSPFGLNQSVTSGIVSALGRSGLGFDGYENFIQTDAPINPGNSGGALINLQGELIGLNSGILTPGSGNVGIGFAVPSNTAAAIAHQLTRHGEVKRTLLGLLSDDIAIEEDKHLGLESDSGAQIIAVLPGSPAARAGLRSGDIVISLNQHDIRDASDLEQSISLLNSGDRVVFNLMRSGIPTQRRLIIDRQRPHQLYGEEINALLTGTVLRQRPYLPTRSLNRSRVDVVSVAPFSAAAHFGLRPGDGIVSVNNRVINNLADIKSAATKTAAVLDLELHRGNRSLQLTLRR